MKHVLSMFMLILLLGSGITSCLISDSTQILGQYDYTHTTPYTGEAIQIPILQYIVG